MPISLAPKTKKQPGSPPKHTIWASFSAVMHKIAREAHEKLDGEQDRQLQPIHLLAGILDKPDCNGYKIIESLGVSPSAIRSQLSVPISSIWPPAPINESVGKATVIFSPETAKLLNATHAEAKRLGHTRPGTDHTILAMLSGDYNDVTSVLVQSGVTQESYRSAFAQFLMSGEYKLEAPNASDPSLHMSTPVLARLGKVAQIRNWAQRAYALGIVTIFLSRFFAPMFGGVALTAAVSILLTPLVLFVYPYFFSTYALSWLLNSRARQGLVGAPISEQFPRTVPQFVVTIFLGLLVTAAAAIGTLLCGGTAVRWMGAGPDAVTGVMIACVMGLDVWVLVVTHWLLTFDVRG